MIKLITRLGEAVWEICYDIAEIIVEMINNFGKAILDNTRLITRLMYFSLPYIMLKIGNQMYSERRELAYGGEIFIPIIFLFIIFTLDNLYKKRRDIHRTIPVPEERFTIVDGSRIEVEHERLEELLVYMQSLEDYLEEEKLLK